jgi:hypothetical protein
VSVATKGGICRGWGEVRGIYILLEKNPPPPRVREGGGVEIWPAGEKNIMKIKITHVATKKKVKKEKKAKTTIAVNEQILYLFGRFQHLFSLKSKI